MTDVDCVEEERRSSELGGGPRQESVMLGHKSGQSGNGEMVIPPKLLSCEE